MHRKALPLAAGLAALAFGAPSGASAQNYYERGVKTYERAPTHGNFSDGGRYHRGGDQHHSG